MKCFSRLVQPAKRGYKLGLHIYRLIFEVLGSFIFSVWMLCTGLAKVVRNYKILNEVGINACDIICSLIIDYCCYYKQHCLDDGGFDCLWLACKLPACWVFLMEETFVTWTVT